MEYNIRRLEQEDLGACIDIFCQTFASEPWSETWDAGVVRARLEQVVQTPGGYGLIAESDRPTGFALGTIEPWHTGSHFYLKELCVHVDYQRQGVGTRLMAHLAKELEPNGVEKIYLLTARGDMAESFYTKLDYYVSPKMIMMGKYL